MQNTTDASEKSNNLVGQEAPAPIRVRFQPTLFIFLGTSSGQVAYRVKKLLKQAYGNVPVLRFLWVDIDTDVDPLAQPWITPAERAELSGLNPAQVIKNIDNHPAIKEWWPDSAKLKAGMLAGGGAPQQMRLIGRLSLFRMFNDRTRGIAFIDRLRAAVAHRQPAHREVRVAHAAPPRTAGAVWPENGYYRLTRHLRDTLRAAPRVATRPILVVAVIAVTEPEEARAFLKDVEAEEGKEFRELLLDGIPERISARFKHDDP